MSKYYQIPKKKRNPRVVHLYDIAAMIVVVAMAMTLLPVGKTLDLSVGFNEKSETYIQAENQLLLSKFEEMATSTVFFRNLFQTSCPQNGGYVYDVINGPYRYQTGEQGYGYYHMKKGAEELTKAVPAAGDYPRGILLSGFHIGLTQEGQVFFSDLEKYAGTIDVWVDLNETPDLAWASAAILQEKLPFRDAARLWSLIQREILVGFDGNQAWFCTQADGVSHIHRGNREGVEEVLSLKGDLSQLKVIDGRYLVYAMNGDLYIRCLKTGAEKHIACSEMESVGSIRQIAYRVHVYGGIRIYTLNTVSGLFFDLSETGAETGELTKMNGLDFPAFEGLDVTGTQQTIDLWFRAPDGYTHVVREG